MYWKVLEGSGRFQGGTHLSRESTWTRGGALGLHGPGAPAPWPMGAKPRGESPPPLPIREGVGLLPWGGVLPWYGGPWGGWCAPSPSYIKGGRPPSLNTPRGKRLLPPKGWSFPLFSFFLLRGCLGEALLGENHISTTTSSCWGGSRLPILRACWIKKEETSSSRTCAHLGGAARVALDRFGSRRRYDYFDYVSSIASASDLQRYEDAISLSLLACS